MNRSLNPHVVRRAQRGRRLRRGRLILKRGGAPWRYCCPRSALSARRRFLRAAPDSGYRVHLEGGKSMATIVCVLYDDPVDGYPSSYARDDIPTLERYPDGQTLPTPRGVDFNPGELLGSVSGELGLRRFLEEQGHTLIVTSDKDGADSVFDRELPQADVVISQPF